MKGAVLFLETSDSCDGPESVDAILTDYGNMGVFDQISGLLIARPYGMSDGEKDLFWSFVRDRTFGYNFPVVGNLDIGHTTPQLTLPIGVMAEINSTLRQIWITEAAVTDSH